MVGVQGESLGEFPVNFASESACLLRAQHPVHARGGDTNQRQNCANSCNVPVLIGKCRDQCAHVSMADSLAAYAAHFHFARKCWIFAAAMPASVVPSPAPLRQIRCWFFAANYSVDLLADLSVDFTWKCQRALPEDLAKQVL